MADRLTLRNDVYVYLKAFDQRDHDPEEINRLLNRAQVEFQNATKIVRKAAVVRVYGAAVTADASTVPGLGSLSPRGSVIAVRVTAAGSGYTNSDAAVAFTNSDAAVAFTGTSATGVAVMNAAGSGIQAVTITNPGEGYTTAPTVTITDPNAVETGATATAFLDGPAGEGITGEILRVEDASNANTTTAYARKLVRTSEEKMDILFGGNWKATTTADLAVTPLTRWMYGKEGESIIRVYPTPTVDAMVRVYYPASIPNFADDDAQSVIPYQYHDALVWWTVVRLLTTATPVPAEKIQEALGHYNTHLEAAKAQVAAFM